MPTLRRSTLLLAVTCAAVMLLPPPVVADETELGVLLGLADGDEAIVGDDGELTVLVGGRYARWMTPAFGIFGDLTFVPYEGEGNIPDTDGIAARVGIEGLFLPSWEGRPFLAGSVGWLWLDRTGSAANANEPIASLGFGQRWVTANNRIVRWELRGEGTFDDDVLAGEGIGNIHAIFGFGWLHGGVQGDSDGDGVIDRRDRCPGTPTGARVDARGCPIDTDGDGVPDGLDRCPDSPAGSAVDASGCPPDADGDGVTDDRDRCPDTPRGTRVDENGCPPDSDGDGVTDDRDRCPDTPRGTRVDANGCPPDADGDGVTDDRDQCPDTPRGVRVGPDGCPPDSDGDGVPDDRDRCPDTPRGTAVGPDGCPERAEPLFEEGTRTLVLEGVNFETDSATLTPDSMAVIDRVAASLRDWPDVRVEIGGHTDSVGSAAYNRRLSERRAASVREALVTRGIEASRLQVRAYGETRPIASNDTEEGRARNRRVELTRLD